MIRLVNLAAILITLTASYALYRMKYEATDYSRQVTNLREEIAAERDLINVLKAEWSYLNEPQRIQRLADQYLELQTLDARQIVTFQELGNRIGFRDDIGMAQSSEDITGSIPSGAD
jgi:cell division protein FtsL